MGRLTCAWVYPSQSLLSFLVCRVMVFITLGDFSAIIPSDVLAAPSLPHLLLGLPLCLTPSTLPCKAGEVRGGLGCRGCWGMVGEAEPLPELPVAGLRWRLLMPAVLPQTVLLLRTLLLRDVLHDILGGESVFQDLARAAPRPRHSPRLGLSGCVCTVGRAGGGGGARRLVPENWRRWAPGPEPRLTRPLPPALRAGAALLAVGAAAPAHGAVLPGGLRALRGLHPRVGPQAPLERRARGPPAGGAGGRPHSERPAPAPAPFPMPLVLILAAPR